MDMQQLAEQIFEAQPFSQFIGAKLVSVNDNAVEIQIELQPHHLQQHGFAHGGVISYLADNAITFAGGLALKGNALTSEYKINYVKPAQGKRLTCRAKSVSNGRKQAVCTAEVFIIDETKKELLCAIAQGKVIKAHE